MKIKKEIDNICLRVLGCSPDPDRFQDTWSKVRMLVGAHRSGAVVRMFEEWAQTQVGKPIKYPVSDFVRVAPGLLRGITSLNGDARLKALTVDLTAATDCTVLFDEACQGRLSQLLREYEPEEIVTACRIFYERVEGDDFALRTAAKKFCEVAPALIGVQRRLVQKQKEQQALMLKLSARREQELAREQAEREAKDAEEAALVASLGFEI